MEKKTITAVLVLLFMAVGAGLLLADDVLNSTEDAGSLYSDHKAYKVGDIVTVLVIESSSAVQSASLSTNKKQKLDAGMGLAAWGGGSTAAFPNVPTWGAGAEEYQNGGGKSTRQGSLMAKISARVEKVLSNGTLMIRGTKVIQINDEKQNLVITGAVRPEDISSGNTVESTYVAEAQIQYEGKGPVGEKTSPGFLTRILDWLGIF